MTLNEFDIWYRARYRQTSSALLAVILGLSDLLGVMLSFGTGFFLVNLYDLSVINFKSFVGYWPYLPIFIIIFQIFRLYPGISLAPAEELKNFTIASLIAHGGIIISRFIEDREFDAISAAFIISFIVSCYILLVCRSCTHSFLKRIKLKGIPAVIFGSGPAGTMIVDRLLANRKMGYVPVLILDDDPASGDFYREIPIIHDTGLGYEIVKRFNIKMAIIAMPELERTGASWPLKKSITSFRYNVLISDFSGISNIWMSVRDFDGVLGLAASHRLKMPWNLKIKRFVDLFIVIFGGSLILPFLLFIALLIKATTPGPVLYKHNRLGLNGKTIGVYKFRSMVIDAEERLKKMLEDPKIREEWEICHKLKDDPRITPIGRFLRRTSLDEFPQIINVLKGEMSLVGPRPVTEDEVKKYGDDFNRIFSVKPGMTGLWQVSGRSDTDYRDRVIYDTYYLQSWSLWLDLWVLYKTSGVVLKGKGAY
ncbi:MAG: undecaprenyl-phosphate galactose phosphotransferase WbaP [Treponema sp.]|jgi:Undecaprenyl-phosphate galactose phosphotransferase WbaP|nr:undecaprenyl-phosphate galactose phosphotransferase WbaP [Treponema sp.]